MSKTKNFRDQHQELLTIAGEISAKLDLNQLKENASEVRSMLSKLLGKLNVHLTMEDKVLYPKLLNSADEKLKSLARRFIDEMGNIGQVVNAYKEKWSNAGKIQQDPATFIQETKKIFEALANRIKRENDELYNAVDEM